MNEDLIDHFLEHYGVKGQKWGVRRKQSRDARSARLKSGTGSKRDKLIREADLDGGRTEAIRKGEIKGMSKSQRVGLAATGVLLLTHGALTLAAIKMGK